MSLRNAGRGLLGSVIGDLVSMLKGKRPRLKAKQVFELQRLEQRIFLSASPSISPDYSNANSNIVHYGDNYVLDLNPNTDDDPNSGHWQIYWRGRDNDYDYHSGSDSTATFQFPQNVGGVDDVIEADYFDSNNNQYTANTVAVHVTGDTPTGATASPHIAANSANSSGNVDEGSTYLLNLTPGLTNDDKYAGSWQVLWGDGRTDTFNGAATLAPHTFAQGPHDYGITATYVTSNGVHHDAPETVTAHVNDVLPTLTLGDQSYHYINADGQNGNAQAIEASPFQLNFFASDPGNQPISQYEINWGDGSAYTLVSGDVHSALHTYTRGNQNYNIAVTVSQANNIQATQNWIVHTTDIGPTLNVTRAGTVLEGTDYVLNLEAHETDGSATHMVSWQINWGDLNINGTQDIQTLLYGQASVTHRYNGSAASYAISVTATDDDGTYSAQLNNDSTFGGVHGHVTTDVSNGSIDQAYTSLVQPDGKVLVAGSSNGHFALLRYMPDGSPDPAFHRVIDSFSFNTSVWANAIALQTDGRILAVEWTAAGTTS